MRRLNVQFTQIEECIEKALFAVDALPRNPPLRAGELLLLQLVKTDATRLGKLDSRVEFALVFDHTDEDTNGSISRSHWPRAGKTWKWILVCHDTVPALPFSLENLNLSKDYSGQAQCVYMTSGDESVVRRHLKSDLDLRLVGTTATARSLLQGIRNYDTIIRLRPDRVVNVAEHTRRLNDPWPGDALKTLYHHKCQICTHDFEPRYGIPHADTRFIKPIAAGGSLESNNRLVVCPNHNAIIAVTKARFNDGSLEFEYPNGLTERLLLRDHLIA